MDAHPDEPKEGFTVEVVDLDYVEPKGDSLNDLDDVAGKTGTGVRASIGGEPTVWAKGQIIPVMHTLQTAWLHGINNQRLVVGFNFFSDRCCFATSTLSTYLGAPYSDGPSYDWCGILNSVNEKGEFVGEEAGCFEYVGLLGTLDDEEFTILKSENRDRTLANDINDESVVVGAGGDIFV